MKIGNLTILPWYLRIAMFVVVAGALSAGFWYFVTSATHNETKEMKTEIAQLLPKNLQASIASQRLNEFRAIYKARQEEYDELKELLPEQRELTVVLQGVQDRARNNGLVLKTFTPKDDVQQDNYSGKKIEVSVTSSFASLRSFFEDLAHYQRIVSVTNFDLKRTEPQTPAKTVDAKFDLTAYYVSAEKLQKQTKPSPATSGAPAQVPAAPQPAR